MKRTIYLIGLILLASLLLHGGCSPSPKGPIAVDEFDSGASIKMKLGDRLEVSLPGNPGTGYSWEMLESEGALLELVGEPQFQADRELAGSPGRIILSFEAVKAGEQILTLVYHRPWETDVEPLQSYALQVKVQE